MCRFGAIGAFDVNGNGKCNGNFNSLKWEEKEGRKAVKRGD